MTKYLQCVHLGPTHPVFLPRDVMHSAVMRLHVVCPFVRMSVCLSVLDVYVL